MSEADRKCAPGYLWPPHLYQDEPSLGQCGGKCQPKIQNLLNLFRFNTLLEFQRLEGLALRGKEKFAIKCGFIGTTPERFFGGDSCSIWIVVFLREMR